jgi:enoyl-CoA hydratase/carnithine racemase
MKLGMNRGLQMTLHDVMHYEAHAQALAVQTHDVREGLQGVHRKEISEVSREVELTDRIPYNKKL